MLLLAAALLYNLWMMGIYKIVLSSTKQKKRKLWNLIYFNIYYVTPWLLFLFLYYSLLTWKSDINMVNWSDLVPRINVIERLSLSGIFFHTHTQKERKEESTIVSEFLSCTDMTRPTSHIEIVDRYCFLTLLKINSITSAPVRMHLSLHWAFYSINCSNHRRWSTLDTKCITANTNSFAVVIVYP